MVLVVQLPPEAQAREPDAVHGEQEVTAGQVSHPVLHHAPEGQEAAAFQPLLPEAPEVRELFRRRVQAESLLLSLVQAASRRSSDREGKVHFRHDPVRGESPDLL